MIVIRATTGWKEARATLEVDEIKRKSKSTLGNLLTAPSFLFEWQSVFIFLGSPPLQPSSSM